MPGKHDRLGVICMVPCRRLQNPHEASTCHVARCGFNVAHRRCGFAAEGKHDEEQKAKMIKRRRRQSNSGSRSSMDEEEESQEEEQLQQ